MFADDTAAFFVGRAIGRHKLAPAISPGKSWEGFVGGTIAGVAVAFFALYEQDVLTIGESLAFGLAVAVASTLGDLFESAVKRDLGVKDSGRILGGHGGRARPARLVALGRPGGVLRAARPYVIATIRRLHGGARTGMLRACVA